MSRRVKDPSDVGSGGAIHGPARVKYRHRTGATQPDGTPDATMKRNHPLECCHVSQAVDGSLVLVKLGERLYPAIKGFEMLPDAERTDLIVVLQPDDRSGRADRGPFLLILEEDLLCLDLGRGFLLDLLPLPNEADIVRIEDKPPLGSMLVIGDRTFLPTITETGSCEILDLERGELLINFAERHAAVIRHWRLGIPTHASGEGAVCTLLDSTEAWPARE